MGSFYDHMYDEVRKQSDMEFAAGQREVKTNTFDYMRVYYKFYYSVTTIMINIPEDRRSTEDNLRIMRGYQHAIEYLAETCNVLISLQMQGSLMGEKKNREYERDIFEMLNKLDDLTTKAAFYLERGQKGLCKVDFDFYLSANRGLLAYYEEIAGWRSDHDTPLEIKDKLNHGGFTPLKFVEKISADLIRNHIAPKLSALDLRQLRDLTCCYHSIANIYKESQSLQECLAYTILAIEANNTIPSAYKTDKDMSKFVEIFGTLARVTYKRNPLLNSIVNIGHGLFFADQARATTEILDDLYKKVVDSGYLAAQQFLLVVMRAIYDNYQVVKYPTNLQRSLQEPSYHTEFNKMMETLKSRVAENKYGKGERLFSAAPVIAKASDESNKPEKFQQSRNR